MNHKLCLPLFLLLSFYTKAQNPHQSIPVGNGYMTKSLRVDKDILKGEKHLSTYYLAMEYDFDDSVSVFIGDKLIADEYLHYSLPDKNLEYYPGNRFLMKLKNPFATSSAKLCTIVFWKEKLLVKFKLSKNISFYSLGATQKRAQWSLTLLNVPPWP